MSAGTELKPEKKLDEEERKRRKKDEEKRKQISTDKVVEPGEIIVTPPEPPKIEVIFIKLEPPKIGTKDIGLNDEIPKIAKKGISAVSLPIIRLQEPRVFFGEHELDCEIPQFIRESQQIQQQIPLIHLKPPQLSMSLAEFDMGIWKPSGEISMPQTKVPIYQAKKLPSLTFSSEGFDSTIYFGGEGSGGSGGIVPEFLETAFGKGAEKLVTTEGPKVILFLDSYGSSYINLLEEVCLRIYREKEGGEPRSRSIFKYDDFWKIELEKWLDPSDKIITVNLDYKEAGRYPWRKVNDDELGARLNELYTGRIGFIIFRTTEMFEEYEKKLETINEALNYRLNIIKLEARSLPETFANLIWGNSLEEISGERFDEIFNKAKKEFNEKLRKIGEEERGLFRRVTRRSKDKEESALHFKIKVFLVRFLTHELRKKGEQLYTPEDIMKRIKTEEGYGEIVPDVQIDSEVYEVETLFGEGENAIKKIDETIDKYDETSIKKVNIVMDNFGFLLHLRELVNRKKHSEQKKFKVEFYTLDLRNKKLMSISEFVEEIKRILKPEVEVS